MKGGGRGVGWGPKGGAPKGGAPKGAFFPSPAPIFALFVSLWGSSRGFLVVFGSAGAVKCARLEFSGCRVKPRNVACLLDLTNTSPWWLRLLGDDCSSS